MKMARPRLRFSEESRVLPLTASTPFTFMSSVILPMMITAVIAWHHTLTPSVSIMVVQAPATVTWETLETSKQINMAHLGLAFSTTRYNSSVLTQLSVAAVLSICFKTTWARAALMSH